METEKYIFLFFSDSGKSTKNFPRKGQQQQRIQSENSKRFQSKSQLN